jgi:hypothetical protein
MGRQVARLGLGHLGVRVAALLRHSDKSGLRGARAAEHQAAGRRKRQRHAAARSSDGASATASGSGNRAESDSSQVLRITFNLSDPKHDESATGDLRTVSQFWTVSTE